MSWALTEAESIVLEEALQITDEIAPRFNAVTI